MAAVTCVVCGREFGPGEVICLDCSSPKPRAPASRSHDEPSTRTMSGSELRAPARPTGIAPAARTCNHQAARPGATNCPSCGTVLHSGAWTIEFPWGTHRMEPGERIVIGREVGPYTDELDSFDTVSRRHAEIRCTPRAQLLLVDEHSTNGTFRNAMKLDPARPVELAAGDQVSFGSSCRAVIQEG